MHARPLALLAAAHTVLAATHCTSRCTYHQPARAEKDVLCFHEARKQNRSCDTITYGSYRPTADWLDKIVKSAATRCVTWSNTDRGWLNMTTCTRIAREKQPSVVIVVLSRRQSFDARRAVRQTWASGHNNVYFVTGTCCPVPPEDRDIHTCTRSRPTEKASRLNEWLLHCQHEDALLDKEQDKHNDMIRANETDVYRHLPQKLKAAYAWALKHTHADWYVKSDDDAMVKVHALEDYLKTLGDPAQPIIAGHIATGWGVHRSGKWAENIYKGNTYPRFPVGSYGHGITRKIADYIVANANTLTNYQGEDTSIGIWMDTSPLKLDIAWKHTSKFANNGNCMDHSLHMVGHNISPKKMHTCYKAQLMSNN